MEENTTTAKSGNMKSVVVPVGIVVIIAIAAIAVFSMKSKSNTPGAMTQTTPAAQMTQSVTQAASSYKDGTYTEVGNYVSPGGPREVGVTITLKGGVITDSTFEVKATDATSKRFQTEFADNYKPMVIGKNIDEVNLTKVSGSSLTPKGFDDALAKVKTQAKG